MTGQPFFKDASMTIEQKLERAVRTVADFPQPGIQFRDITPILSDPLLLRRTVEALAAPYLQFRVTKVVGIEARGFIFGAMLADHLGAGFVPARKIGKLPFQTLREEYELEYGTDAIEMHTDAVKPGDLVLVHDDVIATGGTAAATCRLVEKAGAYVIGCSFLIELPSLNGRKLLNTEVYTILRY